MLIEGFILFLTFNFIGTIAAKDTIFRRVYPISPAKQRELKKLRQKPVPLKSAPVSLNPKPVVLKTTSEFIDFNLLHKPKMYNKAYLAEYKKMIKSLLPEASMYQMFTNREFLPLKNEIKTDKSLFSKSKAKLPFCSSSDEKNWADLKILQLEDSNSVTLRKNKLTGVRVVEKKMIGRRHYDKEIKFFSHAHHGSSRYFPAFICSSESKKDTGKFSIVTDYVNGEKSHVMAARATLDQLRFMVAQFFNSVVELHKVGFIHCDLTPANVMVTSDYEVKLIDFGMTLPVGEAYGHRGSMYTRAPELHELVPGEVDVAIDWWAFGCTVAIWYYYHYKPEAILKTDHIYQFTPMKMKQKKTFYTRPIPSQFPADLRMFLSLFLTLDPELRTFSSIRLQNMVKNHEFFKGFDWSTAEKN